VLQGARGEQGRPASSTAVCQEGEDRGAPAARALRGPKDWTRGRLVWLHAVRRTSNCRVYPLGARRFHSLLELPVQRGEVRVGADYAARRRWSRGYQQPAGTHRKRGARQHEDSVRPQRVSELARGSAGTDLGKEGSYRERSIRSTACGGRPFVSGRLRRRGIEVRFRDRASHIRTRGGVILPVASAARLGRSRAPELDRPEPHSMRITAQSRAAGMRAANEVLARASNHASRLRSRREQRGGSRTRCSARPRGAGDRESLGLTFGGLAAPGWPASLAAGDGSRPRRMVRRVLPASGLP
jgi:hypothetical protein